MNPCCVHFNYLKLQDTTKCLLFFQTTRFLGRTGLPLLRASPSGVAPK
jgi:hypothetical protein